jgi:hypothetical protein
VPSLLPPLSSLLQFATETIPTPHTRDLPLEAFGDASVDDRPHGKILDLMNSYVSEAPALLLSSFHLLQTPESQVEGLRLFVGTISTLSKGVGGTLESACEAFDTLGLFRLSLSLSLCLSLSLSLSHPPLSLSLCLLSLTFPLTGCQFMVSAPVSKKSVPLSRKRL